MTIRSSDLGAHAHRQPRAGHLHRAGFRWLEPRTAHGDPLIDELIIGTGFKDRFSMDQPKNDAQFANFFLDPTLARVVNAAFGGTVPIPTLIGGALRTVNLRRSRKSCGSCA